MKVTSCLMLASAGLLAASLHARALPPLQATPAQTAPAATPTTRLIGTVTALSADSLSLKLESGGEATVQLSPETKMVRTAPGATTLAGATAIHASDLASGDRVLVRALPGADATHYTARSVIAMKQLDINAAHASQAADWQRRGVSGVVAKIDPTPPPAPPGVPPPNPPLTAVTLTNAGRSILVYITPSTIVRRYAEDSANFADAKAAGVADIHLGDQLRARGDRTESAGMERVTAAEVVSGFFRNIAGTILSVDTAQNMLTVTDLATKKPVTLRFTAETQLRTLPPQMAQRLAGHTGSGEGASTGAGMARPGRAPTAGTESPAGPAAPAPDSEAHARGGDPSSTLQRAPKVTLAELKKGDAIMVVATRGSGPSDAGTAITLIAGVEPLLQSASSSASQNLFSASWNLNGGGEAAP